jgi:hypothetical protein
MPLEAYPSGTWSWRVQALGPSGAVLATSAVRTIVVDLVEPVVSEPWEAIARARASGAGEVPVDVRWDGSDTQAGEVRYDVLRSVDGGAFAIVATGITREAVRPLLASGHAYRYAVQAVDAAGHRSAWEYGRTFRVRTFGDGRAHVTYRGSWSMTVGAGYLGRSVHRSSAAGARAVFRFTGRQVAWMAAIGPARGRARVYVDGRYLTTVNLHAAQTATRRLVFTRTWDRSGDHVIRIEVVGTPGHGRVDVDGFVTLR